MRAVLFDVDGVLALPEEFFSVLYTKSHGLELAPFTKFFETEWRDFVIGKRDLKQHIANHRDFWAWEKDPDDLLNYWFKVEDVKNEALLAEIAQLRAAGVPCFVATEQEKYRTKYLREHMFPRMFDGLFSTCEVGSQKTEPKFYQEILRMMQNDMPKLEPFDVVFFDDSSSKVDTAAAVGLDARLYKDVDQIRKLLSAL